jgi:hypothetical protein
MQQALKQRKKHEYPEKSFEELLGVISMIFEEALKAMRNGKKIRISFMPEDEYYAACYVTFKFSDDQEKELEEAKERGMSIVWMKGKFQHPDMGGGNPDKIDWNKITNPCKHGNYPMMNLLWIMHNDWEIITHE